MVEILHPIITILQSGLRLLLRVPNLQAGGGQPIPDGHQQQPGGWNRFAIQVSDLIAMIDRLFKTGAHFRNKIVTGMGGTQIILKVPSRKPIQLFEPTIPEVRLPADPK